MPIVMHYLIPVPKSPAPHMVSGEPTDPLLVEFAKNIKMKFGTKGLNSAPACNPNIVTGPVHRGSGEPWTLLMRGPDGEIIENPIGCPACRRTEAWKKAILESPHPQSQQHDDELPEGCC